MSEHHALRTNEVVDTSAEDSVERWSARLAGLGAAVLLVAGFLMWQREGVAVFADAILSGIRTCF